MKPQANPFEYEAANNLTDEMVEAYYIDDFNYSRFIQSRRNIFLVGDRGSGKTMALLYNRWRLQKMVRERRGEPASLSSIGVYIPCNTPLTYKTEYQLIDSFRGSVLSEHFLVLSMVHALADTLSDIPELLLGVDEPRVHEEAEFVLGSVLPCRIPFFDAIKAFVHRELLETQRTLNSNDSEAFHDHTFTFSSVFVPVLNLCSSRIPKLKDSHFLLLVDDAHALNDHQVRALNSWIAYRDHSLFSFKVAVAKVGTQTKKTSAGGSILEGHDYTTIDLEGHYQHDRSRFFKLAEALVSKRLENASILISPRDFFPMSETMKGDLEESEAAVRHVAIQKFGASPEHQKSVSDHVYKYARAHYFKSRPSKANRPPYSGFDSLVYLSTGVIRNLLEPCFWMFDRVVSNLSTDERSVSVIQVIPPSVQTEVILELSERRWEWLRDRIAQDVEDCSTTDGERAYRLLDNLALHFRDRLLNHKSEPRALSFTISGADGNVASELIRLFDILRKAQLLYVRSGPAKDDGKRETYFVPNRVLWPARGLDILGQHARVSLTARTLWAAAEGQRIDPSSTPNQQRDLWNEEA